MTQSGTISTFELNLEGLLTDIDDGKMQLPDFQRRWVWDDTRIRAIISSVSMSYPMGAVMTMEVGDNLRLLPRPFEGVLLQGKVTPELLVLDGQQRLTALYLALLSDKPVQTTTEKKKEIRRYYYLNMEKCLDPSADRFDDAVLSIPETRQITSDFGRKMELDLSTHDMEYKNGLFPVNLMFDKKGLLEWDQGYLKYFNNDPEKFQFLGSFKNEVWLRFQQYAVPIIKLTKKTPSEAVCKIFENVNTFGVKLTVFELLTAKFAAEAADSSQVFRLRANWEAKKKQLHGPESRILWGVDENTFLTAVTLYTTYQKHLKGSAIVSCKRKDILDLSLDDYKENADLIVEGMQFAEELLAEEKIFSQRDLPYQTQLIPLSVIGASLGKKRENSKIKEMIIQWYWCGVLGELYGGANETRYALDVQGVINWLDGGDVPTTIRDFNFSPTRLLTLQSRLSAAYKGIMAILMKEGCLDFITGSPIELATYFHKKIDIHHIFPAAYCKRENLNFNKWNSIINKAPLSARTNEILGGHPPTTYIRTIENEHHIEPSKLDHFFRSHLIEPDHIRSNNFKDFISRRAALILNIIEDATGKQIAGRDSEEVRVAFEGANLSRIG
jgi:hypothetical protein